MNTDTHQIDNKQQRDLLFEISEDLICIAGFDGYFKQVNPAWTRLLGWSNEELLSKPSIEFVHPDDRERTLNGRSRVTTGQALKHFENRYLCKDGSSRWLSWSSHPSAETSRVFAIARDITRSKKMENQLLYMHRMESVGTLAGGIAHHLNNMLTPLTLTLDFLLLQNNDSNSQSLIRNSQKSLNNGIKLIEKLLAYSKPKPLHSDTISPWLLIQSVLDLLAQSIPSSVTVKLQLEPHLPQFTGDFTMLQQVFVELVINAVDAMPDGGQITISGSTCELTDPELVDAPNASPGTFLMLEVQDEGSGIPPEDLPRIFEPFYSKKEIGKGTGLGLSTAYTVIRNHKGCIRVSSPPHSGCCISVLLPFEEIK